MHATTWEIWLECPWGDKAIRGEEWRAILITMDRRYAGTGATAWEAIANLAADYQRRAVLGLPHSPVRGAPPGRPGGGGFSSPISLSSPNDQGVAPPSDAAQAGGAGLGSGSPAESYLDDWATSVTPAKSHDLPADWWREVDAVWQRRAIDKARRWQARAARHARLAQLAVRLNDAAAELQHASELAGGPPAAGQVVDEGRHFKSARYARARAQTLALDRSVVVAGCGERWLGLRCACGSTARRVGCGQVLLCDRCRVGYYKRTRRRAIVAIGARQAEAMAAWQAAGSVRGERPQVVLVTLTIPRELDGVALSMEDRAKRLTDGWRKLRQWLHKRIGKFAYVGLPEITGGSDGGGHLHYHFVCIWPWWDWHGAQGEWRRATGLPHANPPHMRPAGSVIRAAHYVAKYASKGANYETDGMTAELVGEFVSTYYGRRRVLPSVGFWVPRDPACCPRCKEAMTVEERPERLCSVAASSRWRAVLMLRGSPVDTPRRRVPWAQLDTERLFS